MLKDFYHLKRDSNPYREDAFTLSCLGKIHPASSVEFIKFRRYLSDMLNDVKLSENNEILIIGLTESGIIPAFLMYLETLKRNLKTSILYSTRRPSTGIPFKERHSHGPNHILPLTLSTFDPHNSLNHGLSNGLGNSLGNGLGNGLDFKEANEYCRFKEIWIVEDEITTGNTVCNLIVQLCKYLKINDARVFAFADFRDNQQKADFALTTALNKVQCTVHALNFGEKDLYSICEFNSEPSVNKPFKVNNNNSKANNNLSNINQKSQIDSNTHLSSDYFNNWLFPEIRPALAIKSGNFYDYLPVKEFHTINNCGKTAGALCKLASYKNYAEWLDSKRIDIKTILAVGEAVDLAACIALSNDNIQFQQISLSPWKIDNRSIFSRISFADKYYLYNYENLKKTNFEPVVILSDPIDKFIEEEVIKKLRDCGISAITLSF